MNMPSCFTEDKQNFGTVIVNNKLRLRTTHYSVSSAKLIGEDGRLYIYRFIVSGKDSYKWVNISHSSLIVGW